MMIDEFSAPLGQHRLRQEREPPPFARHVAMGAGVMAAVLLAAWVMSIDHPFRARKNEMTPVPQLAASAPARSDAQLPRVVAPEAPAAAPATRTVTIIDGTSGKRREIVLPETSSVIGFEQQAAEPLLPDAAALRASDAPVPRALPLR